MDSIVVYVEKADDGTYWGTSQNYEGVVSTFGGTFEEMKANFERAFSENLEIAKECREAYAHRYDGISFDYKTEMPSSALLFEEICAG